MASNFSSSENLSVSWMRWSSKDVETVLTLNRSSGCKLHVLFMGPAGEGVDMGVFQQMEEV